MGVTKERDSSIDAIKGLAIILMIIGHCDSFNALSPYIHQFIYSFHMPIFFVISGMFIKNNGFFIEMVVKNAKSYLKPYYITCLVLFVTANIVSYFTNGNIDNKELLLQFLWVTEGKHTNGIIWFLWALFWGNTIFRFLLSRFSNLELLVISASLYVIGLKLHNIYLPVCILQGLVSVIFIYFGYIIKNFEKEFTSCFSNKGVILMSFILWGYCICKLSIHIAGLYMEESLTSCFCSLLACSLIIRFKKHLNTLILSKIGCHTLIILCVHYILKCTNLPLDLPALEMVVFDIISVLIISYILIEVRKNSFVKDNTLK